jgi:hypothetical protein
VLDHSFFEKIKTRVKAKKKKKWVVSGQRAGQFEIAEKKIHQGVNGGRYCKVYL